MSLQICTSVSSVYDVQERCIHANSSSGVFFRLQSKKNSVITQGEHCIWFILLVAGNTSPLTCECERGIANAREREKSETKFGIGRKRDEFIWNPICCYIYTVAKSELLYFTKIVASMIVTVIIACTIRCI